MSENLRLMLVEARQALGGPCHAGCDHPSCDRLRRIDAALAEPVTVHPSSLTDVVTLLENERDEARAVAAHFKEQLREAAEGRLEARTKVERLTQALAMAEQVSGVLCDECGWAMKFPGEKCRCEIEKERDEARTEVERLKGSYQRGAEAMREAAARVVESADDGVPLQMLADDGIRALPIPEDK